MSFIYDIGLETIMFQSDQRFAKELSSIIQKIIDYKTLLAGDPQQVSKTITYCKFMFSGEIAKCIKTHTGLEIKQMSFSNEPDGKFCTITKISSEYSDNVGKRAEHIIDRFSDTNQKRIHDYWMKRLELTPKTAEEMEATTNALNLATGRWENNGEDVLPITIYLHLDLFTGFLARETIHTKLEALTAREVTSMLMHELGHTLSLIERASDWYLRMQLHQNAYNFFKANASTVEQLKYVKTRLINDNEKPVTEAQQAKLTTAVETAITVQQNIDASQPANNQNVKFEKIDSVKNLIAVANTRQQLIGAINIVASAGLSLVGATVNTVLKSMVARRYGKDVGPNRQYNPLQKSGDYPSTIENFFICERLADEYVTRQGMAADFAIFISKVSEALAIINGKPFSTNEMQAIINSSIYYHAAKLPSMVLALFGEPHDTGYTDIADRLNELLDNVLVVFKQVDLPREYLDTYLADYEETKHQIANMSKTIKLTILTEPFWQFIQFFVSPANLLSSITTAKFSQDYVKLRDQLHNLIHSNLFYYAAKLQQFTNKKGE